VPDGRVKEVVDNIVSFNDQRTEVTVSNELVVDELRLRVCRGEINHGDVVFRFNGQDLPVDRDGRFTVKIPKGFCDLGIDILEGILCGMAKE